MEEKKRVCIPSLETRSIRPTLPESVVGNRTSDYVIRRVSRPMRSGVRVLGGGESINWDEVYS